MFFFPEEKEKEGEVTEVTSVRWDYVRNYLCHLAVSLLCLEEYYHISVSALLTILALFIKSVFFLKYQPSTNVIPQLDSTSASDVEDETSEAPDGKGKPKNDKKTALKDKRKRSVDGQAFFACLRNFLRSVSSMILFIGMG